MPDTLLALIPRSALSVVLTAFHRQGYGHVTRVFDPERAPLGEQLGRAGVIDSRLAQADSADTVLLVVHAPMRTDQAGALALAHGARDVEAVESGVPVSAAVAPGLVQRANRRRDRRSPAPVPVELTDLTSDQQPA
jgi:hypothetical protein